MTRSLAALVDTGASFTLASRALAPLFGFDDASLGACPTVRIQGLGGAEEECPRAGCDLLLGAGDLRERLQLKAAGVVFTRSALPGADLLLGQVDALERMELVQCNFEPYRDLILKLAP